MPPFYISHSFIRDNDKSNKFTWVKKDDDGKSKIGRIKLSHKYEMSKKVSVCTYKNGACEQGTKDVKDVDIINSWYCSGLLNNNPSYNVSLANSKVVADENNKKKDIYYTITPPPETVIPECTCKKWLVTVKKGNGKKYSSEEVNCGQSNIKLSLPPNSADNKKYTITAQLYSGRKSQDAF